MGNKPLSSLRFAAALTLVGAVALVTGVALLSVPAGPIVGGALQILAGLLGEVDK